MSVRQDLKIGSLAAYLAWGLKHRAEIQTIITSVQAMMADFPYEEPTTPAVGGSGVQIPSFITTESPEDTALRQAIEALPVGELGADNAVVNQLFDTTDPQFARFDGTLLKALLQNLPALIEAIKLIMAMFPAAPAAPPALKAE